MVVLNQKNGTEIRKLGVVVEIEPLCKNLCLMVWAFGKLLVHEWDKLSRPQDGCSFLLEKVVVL